MMNSRVIISVLGLVLAWGFACEGAGRPPKPPAPFEKVFTVETAGEYELEFSYRNFTTNRHDNIQIRVMRTNDLEHTVFRLVDYDGNYPSVPDSEFEFVDAIVPKTHAERIAFETSGDYRVVIEGAFGARMPPGKKAGWKSRGANPLVDSAELRLVRATGQSASGFVSGAVPRSAKLSSALPARDRLQLAFHQCYGFYPDLVPLLDCGATFNYQGYDKVGNFRRYDMMSVGTPAFGVGKDFGNDRSFSSEPFREACYKTACESVKKIVASEEGETVLNWFSAWEQCGSYDYGPTSLGKFRGEYLPKKYGTIAKLNEKWHAEYKSFDEVPAAQHKDCVGKEKLTDPLALFRARASFVDFRDFCSKEYATWLGLKTRAIYENDPMKRPLYSQYSSNNLGSICWLKWRPLSFEDALQLTIKPSPTMGFDVYGTDDLVAENFEHYASFGDYRCEPMVKEGNTHALGADLAVRTFYNVFAEGMKGWSCFTFQESPKPELRKFGMCDPDDDMAPRPKLAGVADMYRALGQVEPFLAYAKRRTVGKPPAIYYSQTCNVLQERGYGSMFDCAPDSHNRVFEIIRQLGYPCRIITDRQIQETDLLDEVSCVFFCDAQFIPEETMDRLFAWVEKGGHIVADGQTGAFDGHGFPTTRFVDFLGIKPVVRARVSEDVARNLEFGYSDYAFEAVNHDELWLTMQEYLHQRAAKHPIAKKLGKIMFSAFGSQSVRSVAGENIILGNSGGVAWNVRDVGKGTAHYFAGYLGTIYGAGCTEYEFSDKHSENSPYRFIDAYLAYAGAKKAEVNDLPGDAAYYTRFESPLTDAKGNAAMGVVSEEPNGCERSFRVKYAMPKGFREPKMALAAVSGTRAIRRVPFAWDAGSRELSLRLGGFRCWTEALALNDAPPIVSVEPVDPRRDAYGLVDFRPGDEVSFRVKVYNPSPRTLAAGEVELRLSDGWFCDREKAALPEIGAYGESAELVFRVKAPALNCARRVKPVNFVYRSAGVESAPAVELVWFQKAPLEPERPVFGVK